MPSTTTPNMGLTVPTVSQQPGPEYASNINSSLNTIDAHDHSTGQGVPVTPSGLDINSNLNFQGNNAVALRSTRFTAQASPISGSASADIGCVYVAGVDLYYNDVNGNQVRITQSGGVAGAAGTITNLTSPATASYISASQKFVWQSDVNTAADLDARNVILRNSGASSNGLTLQPPNAMAADYNLVLPATPGSQSFVTLDASGNFAAPVVYPLPTAGLANGAVTQEKRAALGQVTSSTTASFSTNTVTDAVAALTTTITTTGRPVMVLLQPFPGSIGYLQVTTTGPNTSGVFSLGRVVGSTTTIISQHEISAINPLTLTNIPPGVISFVDTPAAGTYRYNVLARVTTGTTSALIVNSQLMVYEL